MLNQKEKLDYISLLTVISCFSVLGLHINGCFYGDVTQEYWISANVIECLLYFAVPCFFMITGATLIDYKDSYNTKTYFKKRIMKVLIPYLFWSAIAIIIRLGKKEFLLEEISFSFILEKLLTGSSFAIYWFFPTLFIIYLVIPIIANLEKEKRLVILKYIFFVSFIITSIVPFILTVSQSNLYYPYVSNLLVSPFMYVALGYILRYKKLSKADNAILFILGILGFLSHCLVTYFLSIQTGKLVQLVKGYYTPLCVFYSASIFVFAKLISPYIIKGKFKFIIYDLSSYSFSSYLIHYPILQYLVLDIIYIKLFNVSINSPLFRFTSIFILFPIIYLFTYLIRKIPILKYVLPK